MNKKRLSGDDFEKPEMGDPNQPPEPEENINNNQSEREIEEIPDAKPEIGDESSWTKDQQEKSYYYDDSHGYKIYDPDEEE